MLRLIEQSNRKKNAPPTVKVCLTVRDASSKERLVSFTPSVEYPEKIILLMRMEGAEQARHRRSYVLLHRCDRKSS